MGYMERKDFDAAQVAAPEFLDMAAGNCWKKQWKKGNGFEAG